MQKRPSMHAISEPSGVRHLISAGLNIKVFISVLIYRQIWPNYETIRMHEGHFCIGHPL